MIRLVSPEYDFETFCNSMLEKDPVSITQDAATEIHHAHQLHSKSMKKTDFRKGSRGSEYCEDLQKLISLVMNGSVPAGSSPEFLAAVSPLIQKLLTKWEIGSLRQDFSKHRSSERLDLPETVEPLVLVISREEVESMNISSALDVLTKLIESPDTARSFREKVDVAFHGYNDYNEEIFEIQEVRNYVYKLDEQFPFWLYFLSKKHLGLQALLMCFLPPYLNEEGKHNIFPEKIDSLLSNSWFPALNHIGELVGMDDNENEAISERTIQYIFKGPLRIKGLA